VPDHSLEHGTASSISLVGGSWYDVLVQSTDGDETWTNIQMAYAATPATMVQGPGQVAVTNDGTYNIVLAGDYNAGIWRYVEPN
jgi:hypothetical protein